MYLLRNIYWPYNDSTYEPDGEGRIVELFDSFELAMERKKNLDREYLLANFDLIRRYEGGGSKEYNYRAYKSKLDDILIKEFGFNPTIAISIFRDFSIYMFSEKPDASKLDYLMEELKLEFFSVSEIKEENRNYLYTACLNPCYYEYAEPLMDYHGSHKLFFVKKIEAYKRFVEKELNFFTYKIEKQSLFSGSPEELSKTPSILRSFVEDSPFLELNAASLIISKDIDAETLERLDTLLTDPILLFDKTALLELGIYDAATIKEVVLSNKHDFEIIEKGIAHYGSVEKYKQSDDYLKTFITELPLEHYTIYPYGKILREHLSKYLKESQYMEGNTPSYQRWKIAVWGVITEMESKNSEIHVKSIFGIGNDYVIDSNWVGYGIGVTLEDAFAASFDNWLEANVLRCVEWIKNN